jgi:FkbM family methyltransferase
LLDSLKQLVIRTPFERPLRKLRHLASFRRRRRHPELADLFAEDDRTEAMLKRLLRPDSNCIDVGVHLGSFLSMLLRIAPRGKHMAFEALPDKAVRLRKKFPDVELVETAVSDHKGEISFFNDLNHSGYSGMNPPAKQGDAVQKITVRCEKLDDVVPADRQIDFLKVDVEGAELLVFKGAEQFIARSKPVILFECGQAGLKGANLSSKAMLDYIEGTLGYRVFLIKDWLADGAALGLDRFKTAMAYPSQARNFVAAPPGRRCEPRPQ